MPVVKQKRTTKVRPLRYKDVDYRVAHRPRNVKTSKDITPCTEIIGQQRAISAIKLGLKVNSKGYNIFVTGIVGTGRTTTIKHLLEQLDHSAPDLMDICYVNNFKNEDCPIVLYLKSGDGVKFRKDMNYLISSLRKVVPKIFIADDYKEKESRLIREFEGRQKKLIQSFEDRLSNAGFVMVQVQSGLGSRNEIRPLVDGEPAPIDKLERLQKEGKFAAARLDEIRRDWDSLRREFDLTSIESKKLTTKLEDALEKLRYSMVEPLVADKVNLLKKRYPTEKIITYLDDVLIALTEDIDRYLETRARRGEEEAPGFRKKEPFEEFSVNLVLDNSATDHIPIITEKSPSYKNLFGSIERVVDRFGYWRTDFSRIFTGSMIKATGGFLVINALDLLSEAGVWMFLKRALRNEEMEVTGYDPFYQMAGSGIKPEPIEIDVKVVLIGDERVYRLLYSMDEDFKKIFKIKAEFDNTMRFNDKNLEEYYQFVSYVIDLEDLSSFDVSGMQAVAEYGRRLAGSRDKLSVRFTSIADIIREASFCATQRMARRVARQDVQAAVNNRRLRVNLVEDKIQERFDDKSILIDTDGARVGVVNGLAVYSTGEHSFGRPTRITVNTSLGRAGVINIEREADLSGPIHNKGVGVISGYLRQTFAQDKPLMMSASISFEQSYGGVDGDSASSTELYGILSSLSGIPIKQGLAVTGSVNQKGEIQPIGGVNEKVEGFYDVCNSRGLTGDQGVIIPIQNVKDLLLRPDVAEALKSKKFHVYPVRTLEEGLTVLTGVSGGRKNAKGKFTRGSVMALCDQNLYDMAVQLQLFNNAVKEEATKGDLIEEDETKVKITSKAKRKAATKKPRKKTVRKKRPKKK